MSQLKKELFEWAFPGSRISTQEVHNDHEDFHWFHTIRGDGWTAYLSEYIDDEDGDNFICNFFNEESGPKPSGLICETLKEVIQFINDNKAKI